DQGVIRVGQVVRRVIDLVGMRGEAIEIAALAPRLALDILSLLGQVELARTPGDLRVDVERELGGPARARDPRVLANRRDVEAAVGVADAARQRSGTAGLVVVTAVHLRQGIEGLRPEPDPLLDL